jgi:hypothetical protein
VGDALGAREGSDMDILWVALGVCVIVGFVFVILARHWQRLLAHQAWSIRRLTDRLHSLEEVADPNFRRKLDESAPSPLEQFYTFGLGLSDRFWRDTVETTDAQRAFIRDEGNFLGAVKIERWRSHTVLTVTELLPQNKSANWQTRSFDIFPEDLSEDAPVTLWQMPLAEAKAGAATGRVPTIELRWQDGALALCALQDRSAAGDADVIALVPDERILLSIPLDPERLEPFRQTESSAQEKLPEEFDKIPGNGAASNGHQFVAFYGSDDSDTGIEWHLCLRDLARRSEWDRWRIVEAIQMTKVS